MASPSSPIYTQFAASLEEVCGQTPAEIKAYKLGRKRWSYNEIELVVVEAGGGGNRQVIVQQVSNSVELQDGGVEYTIHLSNSMKVRVQLYLCLDTPRQLVAGGFVDAHGVAHRYNWTRVDRCTCQRGCTGPVLRAVQRFGKLGKRQHGATVAANPAATTASSSMKDPRCMYLSFDEAGSHVGAAAFRLVAGAFDDRGTALLGTAVSPPVRVVANNDMRNGAAHIRLLLSLPSSWEGWNNVAVWNGGTGAATTSPEMPSSPNAVQEQEAAVAQMQHEMELAAGVQMAAADPRLAYMAMALGLVPGGVGVGPGNEGSQQLPTPAGYQEAWLAAATAPVAAAAATNNDDANNQSFHLAQIHTSLVGSGGFERMKQPVASSSPMLRTPSERDANNAKTLHSTQIAHRRGAGPGAKPSNAQRWALSEEKEQQRNGLNDEDMAAVVALTSMH